MAHDGEDSGGPTPAAKAATDKEDPEMSGKTRFLCYRKDVRGRECVSCAPEAVKAGMLPKFACGECGDAGKIRLVGQLDESGFLCAMRGARRDEETAEHFGEMFAKVHGPAATGRLSARLRPRLLK